MLFSRYLIAGVFLTSLAAFAGKKNDDDRKIQIMQDSAVPVHRFIGRYGVRLNSDNKLVTYSWVPNLRTFLANTYGISFLTSNTDGVVTSSERAANGKVYGNGLYVSRNPFDSSHFAFEKSKQRELWAEDLATHFECAEKLTNDSYLMVAFIDSEQKVLDLADSYTVNELKRNGVELNDVYRLNPSVVLNIPEVNKEWMLIKLHSGFTVRSVSVEDIPNDVADQAVEKMKNKEIAGGHWFFRRIAKHIGRDSEI